jgi:hypothetical protein
LKQSENKTKREDRAAFTAILFVFGTPFLGILNIVDSVFGVLLILGIIILFLSAFFINRRKHLTVDKNVL